MEALKPVASLLLAFNFSMYAIVAACGGWALNYAIDWGFVIGNFPSITCCNLLPGPELVLPATFPSIFFPIGNAATGFFVLFALVAAVVGASSAISGLTHLRFWNHQSLPAAASPAIIAWVLTLTAMGLACKEIEMEGRNARLRTMEAFLIILSATQLLYIAVIHGGSSAGSTR